MFTVLFFKFSCMLEKFHNEKQKKIKREKSHNAGHEIRSGLGCLWMCVLGYNLNVFLPVGQGRDFEVLPYSS